MEEQAVEMASKPTVCAVNTEIASINLVLVIVVPVNLVIPENTVMRVRHPQT